MASHAVFAIPGDLASRTGGYAYDREVLARAGRFGIELEHLALPQGFPAPDARDLATTRELLARVPQGSVLLVDGLAFGAFPRDLVAAIARPIVALVHHPLALESGLDDTRRAALLHSEREALARTVHVLAPSAATKAALVADYDVAPERITIAMPGTDPAPRARGGGGGASSLLAVGSVAPRKGYDVLMEALAGLLHLDWTLTVAGSLTRARPCAEALARSIEDKGLASRVRLAGEVEPRALEDLYAAADIFVMSSHFEGYGMVLGEAMARGLPVVTTRAGAAGDTIPDAAALKVAPGDAPALRAALAQLLGEPELRARLADASFTAGRALPTWDDTAARVADVLRAVHQESTS
ncbi:MAG: glycosyltransferase family 4 protein [Beijerinckiaceae bacterium]|nr:glycosyltransferase family 4 protein [Beijerinckiaceae bacterium]MDO9441354.1 glycosyltransferase family 4 protein [Beijerinckiaceae bacterium]